MDRLLELLLRRFVRRGTLRLTTASGSTFSVGDGTGRPVAVRFATHAAQRRVFLDPELRLGEAYMDGSLVLEDGTVADLLALVLSQTPDGMPPNWARPQWALRYVHRRLQQFNPRSRARRNVAHHYDLDGRLYSLFLDADRQYSCAYFESPDQSLDDAQTGKKRHLAPSCCSVTASACSTSAPAGAGLRSISRSFAARA
jgi:cyclopropane-fatty-acyl-phospholipid synthase